MNELKTVDEKTNAERHGQLRERERRLNDEHGRRRDTLIRDDPEWRDLDRESESINQQERSMIAKEVNKDPRYGQASAKEREAREKMGEIDRGIWSDGILVSLENERETYNTWSAREAFVNKGVAGIPLQINQLKAKIKAQRVETALAQNPDEYQALVTLGWGKDQYRNAIEERLKRKLLPPMPEDKNQMRQAAPFQLGKWSTRVDWDGRTPWEKSGGELSPIMKRWLTRMKPYQYTSTP
jgi:hypothetical protein